jgi:hypothetical protein
VQWLAPLLVALAIGGTPGMVAAAPQCVTPPDGSISWWFADGDAIDSQNDHNGTPRNGVTFGTGEVGQAFQLNATQHQYVDVGPINLPITSTFSAWFNPSQSANGEIIKSYDGVNGWFIDVENGQLRARMPSSLHWRRAITPPS